jgi:hypothetical protein
LIRGLADAVIEISQSWQAAPPDEVFAAYGLDSDDVLEVLKFVPTTEIDQHQAVAIGVLIGLPLAE